MKYDVESFCADIVATLRARLNTKLLALDAEKNDGVVLKPVDNAAYFFQELNAKTANYNPYVLYSVEDLPSSSVGPATILSPVVHVVIVVADNVQDKDPNFIGARMLRYQRAMQEIFEENWTGNRHGVKIQITSMTPVQFSLMNSSKSYRAIGIAIQGSIG